MVICSYILSIIHQNIISVRNLCFYFFKIEVRDSSLKPHGILTCDSNVPPMSAIQRCNNISHGIMGFPCHPYIPHHKSLMSFLEPMTTCATGATGLSDDISMDRTDLWTSMFIFSNYLMASMFILSTYLMAQQFSKVNIQLTVLS